jgi:hypothetical protein
MEPTPSMTLDEVAEALRVTPALFRERRQALHAAGFPRPLPALKTPVWSRQQVTIWIANAGALAPAPAQLPSIIADARAHLERRMHGRAA